MPEYLRNKVVNFRTRKAFEHFGAICCDALNCGFICTCGFLSGKVLRGQADNVANIFTDKFNFSALALKKYMGKCPAKENIYDFISPWASAIIFRIFIVEIC